MPESLPHYIVFLWPFSEAVIVRAFNSSFIYESCVRISLILASDHEVFGLPLHSRAWLPTAYSMLFRFLFAFTSGQQQ